MDVKTAIETLEEIILNPTLDDTDEDNLQKIIALLKSLAQEAELGRAAVEALKKLDCGEEDSQPCDSIFKRFGNDDIWCENCGWLNFCRLLAGFGNSNIKRQPSGIELIAAERQRQIEKEGWTAEHDRQHAFGELILAAMCYATPLEYREEIKTPVGMVPVNWPWSNEHWKPTPDRIRELQKAGALIAAEIDRLQRKETVE
ncbi:hypothetical protein M7775_05755 [Sporomusa sphaeroides DSM 2875]|uniref:hypothetical protein n=1 Tax=Sporomusa sphaeroides TaxID=47679 RepID=UPI00202E2A86|nr:hypothetical protein [Sporomusa sphaeroides]MCM0758081.1 hypothetical protein [Sporomusa sphaeroides DSM 2875]